MEPVALTETVSGVSPHRRSSPEYPCVRDTEVQLVPLVFGFQETISPGMHGNTTGIPPERPERPTNRMGLATATDAFLSLSTATQGIGIEHRKIVGCRSGGNGSMASEKSPVGAAVPITQLAEGVRVFVNVQSDGVEKSFVQITARSAFRSPRHWRCLQTCFWHLLREIFGQTTRLSKNQPGYGAKIP